MASLWCIHTHVCRLPLHYYTRVEHHHKDETTLLRAQLLLSAEAAPAGDWRLIQALPRLSDASAGKINFQSGLILVTGCERRRLIHQQDRRLASDEVQTDTCLTSWPHELLTALNYADGLTVSCSPLFLLSVSATRVYVLIPHSDTEPMVTPAIIIITSEAA